MEGERGAKVSLHGLREQRYSILRAQATSASPACRE